MIRIILAIFVVIAIVWGRSGFSHSTEHHRAPDGSYRIVIYGDESDAKVQQTLSKFNKEKFCTAM